MNKKAFFYLFLLFGLPLYTTGVFAQAKTSKLMKKGTPGTADGLTADGFTHLASGLEYKIARHGTGKYNPHVGDHLEMHVRVHVKDSVVFDSRQMNANKAVPFKVQKPSFRGDFIEGLMRMVAGDSALLRLPVDTILKQNKQLMPGMKIGDVLEYDVCLESVLTEPQYKKDQAEKKLKQAAIDTKVFEDFFTKNHINASKTPSGLFYTLAKPGTGPLAKPGQVVSVNYTGRFLEGKTFDSNTDPDFHHPEPYNFALGKGAVIKGWDEGIALLNKGAKGTLYIPSGLAYGSQGNSNIPGNTVLVFDVELVDAFTAEEYEQKQIKDNIDKNKFKVQQTPSGIQYAILQEGKGAKPVKGQKVTVKYTGTTLDGRRFDSNTDTSFHHAATQTITLGDPKLIKGLNEAIGALPIGCKAKVWIPSKLGYGAKGDKKMNISPNTVLVYDIDLSGTVK